LRYRNGFSGRELAWDPAIHAAQVGVAVKDGVVTLTGHLDTYAEKFAIEKAAGRVQGVKALAVEMDVKLAPKHKRNDTEIAAAAVPASDVAMRIRDVLTRHAQREAKDITVEVKGSVATLHGKVDSWPERAAVFGALWSAPGITSVVNEVTMRPCGQRAFF
jgi:osmotically-inducible protein OsmY